MLTTRTRLWLAVVSIATARGFNAGEVHARRAAGVTRQPFGTAAGTPVEVYTLTNRHGIEVRAMTYGAIITSIRVPDRRGAIADVALGFDRLEGYLTAHPYFAGGGRPVRQPHRQRAFTLDAGLSSSQPTTVPTSHGGVRGFDKYVWAAEPIAGASGVTFAAPVPMARRAIRHASGPRLIPADRRQ